MYVFTYDTKECVKSNENLGKSILFKKEKFVHGIKRKYFSEIKLNPEVNISLHNVPNIYF